MLIIWPRRLSSAGLFSEEDRKREKGTVMSRELLTAILEACNDFHVFLTKDLQGQALAAEVEGRRKQLVISINGVMSKINSAHPSIRPRLYIPTTNGEGPQPPTIGNKPAPKLPASAPDEGQEMYIECEPQDNPEDYLAFTSQNGEEEGEGAPQEMYEAMANTDEPLDLYEDPVQGVISPSGEVSPIPQQPPVPGPKNDDGPQDVYEKPVTSPPPPTIPTPTPPPSAENSGSGAVYARTQIIAGAPPTNDTATEWMYDTTKKDEKKLKPSQLENVLCKGNLEKLGGKNKKTWQVRFCALAGPFMYFYEKESSKTYRNRIVLPMYAVAEAPEHTNAKKRHFAFKLTHTDQGGTKKDYFFRSSKWESCQTWVQAMRSLNERTTITPQHLVVTTPTHPAEGGASGADVQQDMYEAIDPMTLSDEEVEEGEDDPDDYVDVVPPPPEDQEEYIDVPPPIVEEDDQENYDDMADLRSPPPPPIPPPPSKTPAPSVSRRRPDPPVDTSNVYSQYPNGINLQNVFVALWDFSSSARDELSVQRGDLVHVVDPNPKVQWWGSEALDQNAASKTGLYGFLPSSYVEAAFELV